MDFKTLDPNTIDWSLGTSKQAEPKSPGLLRNVADTGLQLAQGVLQGGEMLANTFGADNPVSQTLRSGAEWLAGNFSDQLKWEQLTSAQDMKAAELSGSTWEEIKAAARSFGRDPVGYLANAAGTTLPTIAAAFLPGGQTALLGRIAATTMVGAAQGGGAVKGQIYSEVENAWKQAGATPEEAQERAAAAQEYFGSNAGQIAIGIALGGIAGRTGVEAGILGRKAAGEAGELAADAAATSIFARAGQKVPRLFREGFKEAIPEGLQGGQEAVAGNVALQNEGFDVGTFDGAAGNATLEALAGGVFGAATSPFTKPAQLPQTTPAPAADPDQALRDLGQAKTADDAIAAATRAAGLDLSLDPGKEPAPGSIEFEADPLFKDAPTFAAGAAPREPVFGTKLAADIYIGQNDLLGKATPVEGKEGWTLRQTPQAADEQAQKNIENWAKRAQPVTPERAAELVEIAKETRGIDLTAIPLPDGSGWTAVPSQWVRSPGLPKYVEKASAAYQASTDLRRRVDEIRNRPVDRATRTSRAEPVEIDPTAPNAVAQYVDRMRGVNTMAARAFVKDFEAGRITREDVLGLMVPKQEQASADERLAAAAAMAPADRNPATLPDLPQPDSAPAMLLTADGFPYGTRSAAVIRAKREGLTPEDVVQVEGGFAVQTQETQDVAVPDVDGTAPVAAGPADGRGDLAGGSVGDLRPDPADGRGLGGPAAASGGRSGSAGAVGDGGRADETLTPADTNDVPRSLGFEDNGPAEGDWTLPVSKLGDVVLKVLSAPGEPVRAQVSADYMGKRLDTRTAEGLPAIKEAIKRAKDGIQNGRERIAAQFMADERGLPRPENPLARITGAPSDAPAAAPAGGFDSEAWDKKRAEVVQASRDAGNVHLDKVPAYVETMRGKSVFYVHDPKVRGVIRTVDNNGNVYIDWSDAYSAEKELASPVREGKRTVMRSSIGPRDLKDYALAGKPQAPSAAPAPAAAPPAKQGPTTQGAPDGQVQAEGRGRQEVAPEGSQEQAAPAPAAQPTEAAAPLAERVQRLRRSPTRTPAEPEQTDAVPSRALIELRKREAVLKRLLDCMRE